MSEGGGEGGGDGGFAGGDAGGIAVGDATGGISDAGITDAGFSVAVADGAPEATDIATPETTDLALPGPEELATPEINELVTPEATDIARPEATDLATSEIEELAMLEAADLATPESTELATPETEELVSNGDDKEINSLREQIEPTLQRIENGEQHPHRRDGTSFKNREGRLPPQSDLDYYTEYVHPTEPGSSEPGEQRVVTGKGGEIYYTSDHYSTFTKVK